jgi:colanic acid/amylovoran biosynthesis glycosyltransferase
MRIAYFTNVYPKPSHSFIRREIRALEAAGHQVVRFSIRRWTEPLADEQDREELRRTHVLLDRGMMPVLVAALVTAITRPIRFVRALHAARSLAQGGTRGLAYHLIYLAEACLLRWRLAAEGLHHLHVHFGTNPAAVAMLCRLLGGPSYSLTIHGPDEFDSPISLGIDKKIRYASFAVAISQYGRSQLCRWIEPAQYDKCQMVHCGLDQAFLNGVASPVPTEPRLLFVGRLTATKGIHVLLEAMTQLRRRGVACELAIIGDGPERRIVEETIEARGLVASVKMLGWQSQEAVQREMLRSRALVLPSFAEGLPVVLMESLALGRPVITTWVAGVPELVEDGKDGWLVPPGAVEQLARAMEEAICVPSARLEAMARRGREKVLRQHDITTEVSKLAALFQKQLEVA